MSRSDDLLIALLGVKSAAPYISAPTPAPSPETTRRLTVRDAVTKQALNDPARMPWPESWWSYTDSGEAAACRKLWAAALLTCIRGVFVEIWTYELRHIGVKNIVARSWIGSADFMTMCDLAGFDGAAMRDRLRNPSPELIERLVRETLQGGRKIMATQ